MLVVAKAGRVADVQAIAAKWELEATPIGRVTDDGLYRVTWRDQVVAEIPGRRLIEDCPVYHPEAKEDPRIVALRRQRPTPHVPTPPPDEVLLRLLDHPPIASKRWVYEQYDSTVQAGTALGPGGGDAAVIQVRGADFGIAVCTDGNARYVLLDPYEGGKAAVAEAARNVACTGGRPLGITDCLNFGSPERPAVFYQFQESCRGIADACRALDTPVTGGNVSFYNESPTGAVVPTPTVGMGGAYEETGFGLDVDLTAYGLGLAAEALLFSESHGRAVISCAPERAAAVAALAQELDVAAQAIGTVGERGGVLRIRLRDAVVE